MHEFSKFSRNVGLLMADYYAITVKFAEQGTPLKQGVYPRRGTFGLNCIRLEIKKSIVLDGLLGILRLKEDLIILLKMTGVIILIIQIPPSAQLLYRLQKNSLTVL